MHERVAYTYVVGDRVKIKRKTLGTIFELCKEMYPNEIGGILLENEDTKIIDDFVIMPGEYANSTIYIRDNERPIYPNAVGTFHSHPSGVARPSRADKNYFTRFGKLHMIIGYPYNEQTVRVYDSFANPSEIDVTE